MIVHPYVKALADSAVPFWSENDVLLEGIRLNRNFASFPFPKAATATERYAVCEIARNLFQQNDIKSFLPPLFEIPFKEMTETDKKVLTERNLFASYWKEFSPDGFFICASDGSFSATVNGLDHLELRMHCIDSNVARLWEKMRTLDDLISSHVQYMFNDCYGYLTASSHEAGTGMHCYCLIHLPLISLLDEFQKKSKTIEMLGFSSVPFFADKNQAHGNLFWIGNLSTIGEREDDLILRMKKVTEWLLNEERYIRQDMFLSQPELLLNPCGRAYGLLKYARILTQEELLDALSMLKLGVDSRIFRGITSNDVLNFRLNTLSGHIQAKENRLLTNVELYHVYADDMRKQLHGPDYTINFRNA